MSISPDSVDDWRAYGADVLPPILRAALDCFAAQGYHGTSIRQIASRAELSVPGLYHHYPSKQALLVAVLRHAMKDLWARSQAAADAAGPDPEVQLAAQVENLVLFHACRQDLAFIAWSELRSLTRPHLAEQLALRDRQQRVIDAILEDGYRRGVFTTPWPRESSRGIVTLCTSVAQWYRPDGEFTPAELARRYSALALAMANA